MLRHNSYKQGVFSSIWNWNRSANSASMTRVTRVGNTSPSSNQQVAWGVESLDSSDSVCSANCALAESVAGLDRDPLDLPMPTQSTPLCCADYLGGSTLLPILLAASARVEETEQVDTFEVHLRQPATEAGQIAIPLEDKGNDRVVPDPIITSLWLP